MSEDGRGETKQDVIDDVSQLLSIGPFQVGKGSTEPAGFFVEVAKSLGIGLSGNPSKPEIARMVVESAGMTWGTECDSRGSESGGGSTVTTIGLKRLRTAVHYLAGTREAEVGIGLDIRPGIELLLGYRNHGYKIWYAVAELVDNSIASFRTSKRDGLISNDSQLKIAVQFDHENRSVTIEDNAGGIAYDRLEAALTAGKQPNDLSDLNQFGFGMKAASFWFGSRLEIVSYPAGAKQKVYLDVDLPKMINTRLPLIPVVEGDVDQNHGTKIVISRLWPERSMPEGRTLGKVRSYLSSIYRRDLGSGEIEINVDGLLLEPPKHPVLVAPRWDIPESAPLTWEKFVEFDFEGRHVTGLVWLLERGDTANAGLVLSWRGKAIVGAGAGANDANDSFRPVAIYGRSNSFVSQRLMGELDVSAFQVTSTKDDLEWTEEDQSQFAKLLREEIDSEPLPLIKMAQMYRKRIKVADGKQDVITAGQSLVDALSQAQPEEFGDVDFSILEANLVDNNSFLIPGEVTPDLSGVIEAADLEFESASFDLPPFLPGMASGSLVFLNDISDKRVVRWRKDGQSSLVIEINRSSRFMENYASLPQFHLEPVVRMLVAFVILEIELRASGSGLGDSVNSKFNQHLNRTLGLPVLPHVQVEES